MLMQMLVYSALIFLAGISGGLLPLWIYHDRENPLKLFVSLGAGLLLGMTFLHILPEVSEKMPHSFGPFLLFGFVLLLLIERFVMVHACEETDCDYHAIGVSAFFGLTLHGLIEGMALGSSILAAHIGPLVFFGIVSHKVPAGFALTSLLKLAKKSRARIILFNMGVAASVPVGCFLSLLILKYSHVEAASGILLSVSAGTFLYIAACDLLPELHKSGSEKFKRLCFFLAGIGLAALTGLLFPHTH